MIIINITDFNSDTDWDIHMKELVYDFITILSVLCFMTSDNVCEIGFSKVATHLTKRE